MPAPASAKKQKMPLAAFTSYVLPNLRVEHKDSAALQKAVNDFEIFETDADGNEQAVVIDVKQLDARKDATASTELEPSAIEALIRGIVEEKAAKIVSNRPDIRVGEANELNDPKAGFKTFGDYSRSVKAFAIGTINKDDREKLFRIKAPTTYANEGIGADGGFLVPVDYSKELLRLSTGDMSLLPLTRQITVSGNTLTLPVDTSTPWDSTGVQAFWTPEAGQKPESKPQFSEANITLHKLTVLVPVTDELLQDSFVSLGSYIADAAGERIMEKVNTAIVRGTGVGQPLGYRNSSVLKTVAKETSQTADTVNVLNLAKMFAAMQPSSITRAVWLHNPSVFPQLVTTTIGNQPVWANSIREGAASGNIFGRPAYPSMQMSPLGDAGDVDFVDLSQYVTITKGTGIEQAISIHLYFDRDITTFRFVLRIGGRPWMTTPWSDRNSQTYSPFVTLAERA